MANAESLERAKREQPQPQQQCSQWPTQSQEHVYEFEGAYSPTRSMESNTYAEVGPFGAVVRAKSYTVMCLGYHIIVTLVSLHLSACGVALIGIIMNSIYHAPLKRYNACK